MTLSRRHSRNITVDDVDYTWAVAARSQGDSDLITLAVHPPQNGQRLSIQLPCRDPYLNIGEPIPDYDVRAITPKLIAELINVAKDTSWSPTQTFPPLDVKCVIAELKDDGGESGATCHVCWQCQDCEEWYSDDVAYGEKPPIITTCGRTRRHASASASTFILFW